MSTHPRLSVVIPAFNEASRLPATLRDCLAYLRGLEGGAEIVVVDDGSEDGTAAAATAELAGNIPHRVLQHADGRNRGKGAAVRLGMLAAEGDYRLFMDADSATTIEQASALLETLTGGADLAIGSRRTAGATIGRPQMFLRDWAGRIGNLLVRALVYPGSRDTQAGFKAFTAACAEDVFGRARLDGWAFDVEVLAIARQRGYRAVEVPIVWRDVPDSRVRGTDYFRFLLDLLRLRRDLASGRYD